MPAGTQAALNANLNLTPLEESERTNAIQKRLYAAYLHNMDLHEKGLDVYGGKTTPDFQPRQKQAFNQIDELNKLIESYGKNQDIPNLIDQGHSYRPLSPDLEQRIQEGGKRNPLTTDAYSSFLENPKYKQLRDIYRQEATEHFKRDVLPAIRTWHATHGTYNTSIRGNAEAEETRKFTSRMERDLTKMLAEQHEKAAEYAMQNEHRGKEAQQLELTGRVANKPGFLQTAEAKQANQQNIINNELKRASLVGGVGTAEQELDRQHKAEAAQKFNDQVGAPMKYATQLSTASQGLPVTPASTFSTPVQERPVPPNPIGAASGYAQGVYSQINPGQKMPGIKAGGHIPRFDEGGQVPMGNPAPQGMPPMPVAEYTPEQRILLQMVQNYQKKSPMARMFETTGAHQLANIRRDPTEVFGEGMLAHQQIERDQQKAHVDIISKVADSRNQQHKLLAEMGLKTRELDIDERHKKGLLGVAQTNAATDKAYKEAHMKQFGAETALKEFELEKGKGNIGAKKAIANFGLSSSDGQESSHVPLMSEGIEEQQLQNKNLEPQMGENTAPIGNEIEGVRADLHKIRELRAPYGGAEMTTDERKKAHEELVKARELKKLTDQGLTILNRMGKLNPKISSGSLFSRSPEFLKGAANNIRGNVLPWEKGTESEIDEFDNLSNSLVAVEKNIDALGGGGKGSAGIGFINFLQSGKPSGKIGTKANENEIARYATKYQYLNDKNTFITRAAGEYMLTPDEAETIFDKLENQGINPIEIFESKKKPKNPKKLQVQNEPKSRNMDINSRIAQLESELGSGE